MINNLLLQKTLKTSNPIKEFLLHFLIKNDLVLTVGTALTDAQRKSLLTGKFRDQNTGVENVVNVDSKLKSESAFDSIKTDTTVERVKPNYAGIAVVAGVSVYAANSFINAINPVTDLGPQVPIMLGNTLIPITLVKSVGIGYTAYSGASNMSPNQQSLMDPLVNIRSKDSSSSYEQKEIKTNLNFNNLITN